MNLGDLVEISANGRRKKWISHGCKNILSSVGVVIDITRDGMVKVLWPEGHEHKMYFSDLRKPKKRKANN